MLYNNSGFTTLISVLIVGSVSVAIATSLLFLSVDSSRLSISHVQSARARSLASLCVENALQLIHDTPSYVGSGSASIGSATCDYAVVNTGGETRVVQSTGVEGVVTRKIKVIINSISPNIDVGSWQDVSDF